MKKLTRIRAAIVSTTSLTIYRDDGTTLVIPQGDPRVRRILAEATPQLVEQRWADVNLEEEDEPNHYADFEAKSSGLVKLFRVAKSKLKALFGGDDEPVPPMQVGTVPMASIVVATPAPTAAPTPAPTTAPTVTLAPIPVVQVDTAETFEAVPVSVPTKTSHMLSAVEEIMKHAVPVSSEKFSEDGLDTQRKMVEASGETKKDMPPDDAEDTIIAVVDNKVIPNMERIKNQFGRASKLGSTKGMEAFLRRLSTVIEHRRHSVDDLLKFLERADLPIADDGSILIYKVLKRASKSKSEDGAYVDCHTGNVEQWTGAYVCMDPSLVDHNRSTECSNGLHVARRGYVGNFHGHLCVLAKLAPEDVITVPTYDANKMRVCGYHILAELTQKQYGLVKMNKPISDDPEGQVLLANALAGKHIHKTHEVRITGQKGAGVVVKKLDKEVEAKPILSTVEALEKVATPTQAPTPTPTVAVALSDTEKAVDVPIDPKAVVEQVEEAAKVQQLSRKEQAQKLYKDNLVDDLIAFKKQAKVGWDKLGITDPRVLDYEKSLAKQVTKQEAKPKAKATETKKGDVPVKKIDFNEKSSKTAKENLAAMQKTMAPTVEDGSPRERIAKLMEIGLDATGVAQKIYDIKKASKKSWDVLAVSENAVAQINKILGK